MCFAERQGILRCLPFDQFSWQDHGFGGRRENPAAKITLRQIHSAEIRIADGLADREAQGDGLLTASIGLSIGVRTADCVPILMLDSRTRAVAAIHAGWRGTAAQIAERALAKLAAEYGSRMADLHVAIGPCIRPCCYQVSDDVATQFERWPESVHAVADRKPHIDLACANRRQLLGAGLIEEQVSDCGLCTACQRDRFFSYRAEPEDPGRMLSAIVRTA